MWGVCGGGGGGGGGQEGGNEFMHATQHIVLLSSMLHVCNDFNADNAGAIAGAVIGVLLFLAIIVGVVIAVGYLVWRSKSAKYIARRYANIYVHAQ